MSVIDDITAGTSVRKGASVAGVVREEQLKPNPDTDFVFLRDDFVPIIRSEENREAFVLMASFSPDNKD